MLIYNNSAATTGTATTGTATIGITGYWQGAGLLSDCTSCLSDEQLTYYNSGTGTIKYRYGNCEWEWDRFISYNKYLFAKDILIPPTLAEKIAAIIKSRISPAIHIRHKPQLISSDIRETRARETLRRVIGEVKFRNFLKTGFVSAKNQKSGLVYQIFPGHGITCVYKNGKMIERLCVVLKGNFPPTDSVIVRYLMVLNNEEQFKSLAIKHVAIILGTAKPTFNEKSLSQIMAELKTAATKKVAA